MKDLHYLYAAYAATWAIHITYLWAVARRYQRLRKKLAQLQKP